jgi:hypothetical protein
MKIKMKIKTINKLLRKMRSGYILFNCRNNYKPKYKDLFKFLKIIDTIRTLRIILSIKENKNLNIILFF